MYAGAFVGFAITAATGSIGVGLLAAVVAGALAGLLMGLLTVSLGVNQHVAGIGTTLLLIGLSEFVNRLRFGGGTLTQVPKMDLLFPGVPFLEMYALTLVAFAVVAPLAWWVLRSTGAGLRLRAVGENPEAADAAGINVSRTRYAALVVGGALMAVGGAFLTLAVLGTFTLNITNGRGWVAIALVIFARWRIGPAVLGGLLFAVIDAGQAQPRRSCPPSPTSPARRSSPCPISSSSPPWRWPGRDCAIPGPISSPIDASDPSTPAPDRAPGARPRDRHLLDPTRTTGESRARRPLASSRRPSPRPGKGSPRAISPSARRWWGMTAPCSGSATTAGSRTGSAIRHGETDALERAGRLPAAVYARSTMYTTLSPCHMCTDAILLYGIPRVVIGENRTFLGAEDLLRANGVEVVNLDSAECVQAMTDFIAANPALWNEDIGVTPTMTGLATRIP